MTTLESEPGGYLRLMRDEGWLCTFGYSYTGDPAWVLYPNIWGVIEMIRDEPWFGINEEIMETLAASYDLTDPGKITAGQALAITATIKELTKASHGDAQYFDGPFTFEEMLEDRELADVFAESRDEQELPPERFGADIVTTEKFLRGFFPNVGLWKVQDERFVQRLR